MVEGTPSSTADDTAPEAAVRPRATAEVAGHLAVLGGLVAIAVTQPLLDLLGQNPEFFVSGHYRSSQIVALAVLVALLPWLLMAIVVGASSAVHRGFGGVVFWLCVAGLGATIAHVLVRGAGLDPGLVVAVAIALVGALVVVAIARARPGRMFIQFLAVANLFFLGTFLLGSPTSRLLEQEEAAMPSLGHVDVPELEGPVVMVILDELPLTTLLRDDGTLNDERFPNFARLADRSTWFRNASAHISMTHMAVPTLLTGRNAQGDELPTWKDHPRNLLNLLGRDVPVDRYEVVTDLCHPAICDPPPADEMSQAAHDAAVIYLHRVLPPDLRRRLPPIDHAWGGFGEDTDAAADAASASDADATPSGKAVDDAFARWKSLGDERSAPTQAAVLVERGTAISADPSLHLIHVALPHNPWILSASGSRLREEVGRVTDPSDPAFEWSTRLQFQMQSMQLGAADAALGTVLDHFDDAHLWDKATLVVTSDHGLSMLPPDFGRKPTDTNQQELYRVPLFIHAAHQSTGKIDDDPAQTMDVLPSLVDLLDIDTDWTFEGHSLFDGSERRIDPRVGTDFAPALEIVRRHHEGMTQGWDWDGLVAVGDHAALVGRSLDDLTVGSESSRRLAIDHADDLADLPADGAFAPQVLTGVVEGPPRERPPELVVAVNGTIGGVLGGYVPDGPRWRFAAMLGPYLVDGPNTIQAFEVEGTGSDVVLHPLG